MRFKFITVVMAGTFCFILMATIVQASIPGLDITVDPQKIPIGGTVEITITSEGTNVLDYIMVIDWLGNIYSYDVVPDVTLGDGDTYKLSFGPGVSGWIDPWGNPGADTSLTGWYDVAANYYVGYKAHAFEVIPAGVPEFPLALPVLTSLAAILYLAFRKRIEKNPE